MTDYPAGVPDPNAKPSLVLFDSVHTVTFAWEGNKTLGAAYVQIVDNSGDPIVTFGSPTEYDNNSTVSGTPKAGAIVWDNAGTWNVVSDSNPLPVSATLDTTGLATSAKQDTGNTSLGTIATDIALVALESGGNLDTIVTNTTDIATIGAKTDAADTHTDGTSISIMSVLKEISAKVQSPASTPVTGTFWQATQPVSGTFYQVTQPVSIASGGIASGGVASGAFASGSIASGAAVDGSIVTLGAKTDAKSTATDGTSTSIVSILKQISASVQAPPSQAVTNAGTFVVQENGSALTALQLIDNTVYVSDAAATSTPSGNMLMGHYSSSPGKISASDDAVSIKTTQEGKILSQTETVAADTTNINNNYSSAQTNTSQQSAPGANKRIVVTQIMYSRDTAGNMKLVEDPAGTPATKFGPHYFPANGGMVAIKCYIPLTTNKALGITTVGGGNETLSAVTIIENV